MVDLALVCYRNPTIDLVYFAYISTTYEFRKKYMDSLLDIYHKQLTKTLAALGIDPSVYILT